VQPRFISLLAFILLAVNLRPALTGIGPLISSIQQSTGLSGTALGLLGSFPLLAFAMFSPLAGLGRRFGLERAVAVAMILLFVGILIRSIGSVFMLYAGTLILAAGIAVGNVLAPSIIKRDYPEKVGTVTTVYALVMALCSSIASGLSVPFALYLPGGWRGALAFWAIPAAAAALLWARAFWQPTSQSPQKDNVKRVSVWRSPLAWCVTAFTGLQSLYFYVMISWLPMVLEEKGRDPVESGLLLTGFQLVSLVAGAVLPKLMSMRQDQKWLAISAPVVASLAALGLLALPSLTVLWIVLAGFGTGLTFPMAIAFIGLRSRDHHEATSLSMMAQSLGYLLAALGPLLFGSARDWTGGWNIPLAGLAIFAVLQAIMGYYAGANRTVSQG